MSSSKMNTDLVAAAIIQWAASSPEGLCFSGLAESPDSTSPASSRHRSTENTPGFHGDQSYPPAVTLEIKGHRQKARGGDVASRRPIPSVTAELGPHNIEIAIFNSGAVT
jgi:hypothetical protein